MPFPLIRGALSSRSNKRRKAMAQENCALGAPQEGFARPPTGFRRMTPGLLRADRTAEGFSGLPESVRVAGQLLAALKSAAPRLGIGPRLVHAVDWLFR